VEIAFKTGCVKRREALMSCAVAGGALASQLVPKGVTHAASRGPVKPNIQAASSVIVDLQTQTPLYEKKPDRVRPIASISKLAAALVAARLKLDPLEITTISKADQDAARGGARSRLLVGMTVSNLDLLHATLLGSDNRAVVALGRAVGLSTAQLTRAMNKLVGELGLKNTRFSEPTGISRQNVSTALESVGLLEKAMADTALKPVLARLNYECHPVNHAPIPYVNTYTPALRPNAEVFGGKTGYNDFARYCLVMAARVDGRMFGMAFLGTEGKMTRFGDFARACDWLIAHKPHKHLAEAEGRADSAGGVGEIETGEAKEQSGSAASP